MKDGILLELLAELFQAMTAAAGVTVSRRHVFRIQKGDISEVDILLDGRFGSTKMKVAVECRDRAEPQGKEWIQQIIGKRDDLRRVGIRHWVAVSNSGFTMPARELAERAGIELLVPYTVEPADASAPGPHKLLRFQLTRDKWEFGEVHAEIGHEDQGILEDLQARVLSGALAHVVIDGDEGEIPFLTFLVQAAETQQKPNDRRLRDGVVNPLSLEFVNLAARLHNVWFTLTNVKVEARPLPQVTKGTCKLLTFSDPSLFEFMGLIGLNQFELDGEQVYLLVGFRPGYPAKLICHARSSNGTPISGWVMQLDENQLQGAGFQSRPPEHAGSALLNRLLNNRN